VREPLDAYAKPHPEVRVMAGRFEEIRQAIGTPKGRTAGAAYLRAFVEEMKANGFIADALQRSGQTASVAPPAS
jgi:polar amino acid transport system substrate-binding protein